MKKKEQKPPSDELEKEIIDHIFNRCDDHRGALKIWLEHPWKAVSFYEAAVYPELLSLPLVLNKEVKISKKERIRKDVDEYFGFYTIETEERAQKGEYDLGKGDMAIVNKFGRVINPEDIWRDEDQT